MLLARLQHLGICVGWFAAMVAATEASPALAQNEPVIHNPPLRICSDPNNMPFSNRAGEGFENKLAEMLADQMDREVSYTWHAQRRGFLRDTLNAYECDVVMGVPNMKGLTVTRSYYRSSYVFVTRTASGLGFSSMNAPELEDPDLRIGVHLVGDDGANTPPAEALSKRGIIDTVIGYSIYGDYREDSPPSALIKAVADGEIDVAALWGPIAGYFAKQSEVPLSVTPITGTVEYLPQSFQFPIGMGVRPGSDALETELTDFIIDNQDAIDALLKNYGVPLM